MKLYKMKNIIFSILLFFSMLITYGQKKKITKKHTTTHFKKLDLSKIYNKKTGKKIKEKKFIRLIKKHPNLNLEEIINEDGKIVKYLVDLSNVNTKNTPINNRKKPILKGELFPNFIAKTIHKKKIELKELKGKIVILRFELEANSFRFKKQEIKQIDLLIDQVKNKHKKIKAIIFFEANQQEIKKGFDLPNSNFELIPNAINFIEKFSITRFPTTIILDINGKVINYYNNIFDIDLDKISINNN